MSRFQMPTEPKNGLDLLRWFIFEPVLLKQFEKTLSKKETLCWLLKAYSYIIILSVVLYVGDLFLIVALDLPSRFPQLYESKFMIQWQQQTTDISQFVLLYSQMPSKFVWLLIIYLFVGTFFGTLTGGLGNGLAYGLTIGTAVGFLGLCGGLGGGLGSEPIIGLGGGLIIGLSGEPIIGLSGGLIIGLGLGFLFGLGGGLKIGLLVGLGFISTFYLMYFRLLFYPFHFIYSLFAHTFKQNPYLNDGRIYLPLFSLNEQLVRLAHEQPENGVDFAYFLLNYRPFQKHLAVKIFHTVFAAIWGIGASTQDADLFIMFSLSSPEESKEFTPSENWLAKLDQLRTQLINSQTQTQIGLRRQAFEEFFKLLKEFRTLTLLESRRWNSFYIDALDVWLKVSTEHIETLKQQAELFEPIASNLYKSGEALQAQFDDRIFVGRNDLKDALSFEILTARQMPLFLIQGQRRVGKTSLLNFLPLLLGPRFKIVSYDLQGLEDRTLSGFFFALRNTINKAFGIREETAWNPPDDWLRTWGEFREYVEQLTNGKDFKLVLAFDEYEILHDDIFQRDPQQAARLLGAMRSFSQSQNQVVFLFVGARFFSDLQQPNWNEYFVQVKHLRVDYLKRPDVLHLIQRPTPDFGLVYADDLANRIFDLTQGHPALVQQICSEMVNLANMTNHRRMTHEDLDQVLREKTLFRENLTIQIFWTQFCAPAERATVKQILAGETPTDPVSRYRLELHGYIVKDGDNWNMRVPLFEQWLRKYIETFPI